MDAPRECGRVQASYVRSFSSFASVYMSTRAGSERRNERARGHTSGLAGQHRVNGLTAHTWTIARSQVK